MLALICPYAMYHHDRQTQHTHTECLLAVFVVLCISCFVVQCLTVLNPANKQVTKNAKKGSLFFYLIFFYHFIYAARAVAAVAAAHLLYMI